MIEVGNELSNQPATSLLQLFDLKTKKMFQLLVTLLSFFTERFSTPNPTVSARFHYFYHVPSSSQASDPPARSDFWCCGLVLLAPVGVTEILHAFQILHVGVLRPQLGLMLARGRIDYAISQRQLKFMGVLCGIHR